MVRTVSQIYEEVKAATIAENPALSDWHLNSFNRKTTMPFCMVVQQLEQEIADVATSQNPKTATGAQLDALVADRGIYRLTGTKATGSVNFVRNYATTINITIPAGTPVATEDEDGYGAVRFFTTETVILAAGQTSIAAAVIAEKIGERGNVRAGAINKLPYGQAGIDYCLNPLELSGGGDSESDLELQQRYIAQATLYGRSTIPTMEQRLLGAINLNNEKIVRESKVTTIAPGLIEVIVDIPVTEENAAIITQALYECMPGGICSAGMYAAHLENGANLGDIGDAAGGALYVLLLGNVLALDEFTITYLNQDLVEHTASFSIPAGSVAGTFIAGDLQVANDEVLSISDPPIYTGVNKYNCYIGYGAVPRLFLIPEKVAIDVTLTYEKSEEAATDLKDVIEASIAAFLDDFIIGEELQFSDLYDAARIQYTKQEDGSSPWGDRIPGIDAIISISATDGTTTITQLGEKITIDSDARIDPGDVAASEAT